MSKLKGKVNIRTNNDNISYDVNCIFQEEKNKIIYKEPDNTTTSYDYETNTLLRKNDQLEMEYKFQEDSTTIGRIYIKELNKNLDIIINTKKIINNNKNIEIEYLIENEKFKYSIEVK